MKPLRTAALAGVCLVLTGGLALAGEYSVKGVHNCCGACCKLIHQTLGKVEGVSNVTAKPKEADFTFEAADKKTAQKAVNALAKAGFYGKVEGDDVSFKTPKVKEGKVTRLALAGAHNCCPMCCKAIKGVVAKVDGVQGENVKPKARSFVVEGNFDAAALIKALNEAGFSVRVKKEK